jgi:AcrR family transcriptional regulator
MPTAGSRKDPGPTASDKILHAAMSLFVTRGYPSTTVEMIAQEAGVAVQTVYFSFRAKVNILKQLVDINVAGDTQPTAILQRAWVTDARRARSRPPARDPGQGDSRHPPSSRPTAQRAALRQ